MRLTHFPARFLPQPPASADRSPELRQQRRWPRRAARLVVATGLLSLVAVGVSIASIPDGSGVIHGCYNTTSGALKVIDSAKVGTCPTGSTSLNWSQTGPQGPAGATGSQGPAGVQGPVGPQGPAASVSDYPVTATVTVPAYGYAAEYAQCTNPADTVTGGGMSDSLYLGSSGALLESFPTTVRSPIVGGGYDQAWQVDVNNNYSQPEQFTVYAICQHTSGS